mmetsp:Transcript_10737/g.29611  ORF Transcript_10737/g.29611 Transcript_10737/m.29611 type:complete len:185 (-) Transcript_10737:1320-1874(-)
MTYYSTIHSPTWHEIEASLKRIKPKKNRQQTFNRQQATKQEAPLPSSSSFDVWIRRLQQAGYSMLAFHLLYSTYHHQSPLTFKQLSVPFEGIPMASGALQSLEVPQWVASMRPHSALPKHMIFLGAFVAGSAVLTQCKIAVGPMVRCVLDANVVPHALCTIMIATPLVLWQMVRGRPMYQENRW